MAKNETKRKLGNETLAWVEKHPELVSRIERLREVSEDSSSDLDTVEKAERAVMEELERLGSETLRQWLEKKQEQADAQTQRQRGVRRHSKKNSG